MRNIYSLNRAAGRFSDFMSFKEYQNKSSLCWGTIWFVWDDRLYNDVLLKVLLQWQAVLPQKVIFWPLLVCVAWMSVSFIGPGQTHPCCVWVRSRVWAHGNLLSFPLTRRKPRSFWHCDRRTYGPRGCARPGSVHLSPQRPALKMLLKSLCLCGVVRWLAAVCVSGTFGHLDEPEHVWCLEHIVRLSDTDTHSLLLLH